MINEPAVPKTMHAMVMHAPGEPLRYETMPVPRPEPGEVLVRVHACGVCRTDLHIVDGELPPVPWPVIPGHEVVGSVAATGSDKGTFSIGERVGIPWLGATCGECWYCHQGRENLCDRPIFTGYTRNGGYAQYAVADERFCFRVPDDYDDVHAAPLLCAGLIGFRSYRLAGTGRRLGFFGFGASAHILAQIALNDGRLVYAFTRAGDEQAQEFARRLGCTWVGDAETDPPAQLDAAIIFAPVGALVPIALRTLRKGGCVICAGIHMSDIPSFEYNLLWEERSIRSVANLERRDGIEFFEALSRLKLRTEVVVFPLEEANRALELLRSGKITGAAVLVPETPDKE